MIYPDFPSPSLFITFFNKPFPEMKIDINDPRITAFALGELQGPDAVEIARAVHSDSRIRTAVDEVRETSFVLWNLWA